MGEYKKISYNKEYNKNSYKTVKVYIPINEYNYIKLHSLENGYESMSGYIKSLIQKDMNEYMGGGTSAEQGN